jgi:fatty-acid peroxygenase
LFYDESVVERHRAVPLPLAALLIGPGAVHGLDDDSHHHRKSLFLDVLSPGRTPTVATDAAARLAVLLREPDPSLPDVLARAYGGAVLSWAGLAPSDEEATAVSRELFRIVDGFGFSAAYPRAWVGRIRSDRWLRARVREVRAGDRTAADGTALAAVSATDLDDRTAAVELNNVVRPTVAVTWLATYAAAALQEHPAWRERLRTDPAARVAFAQEVRRTAPFVPALAARVRRPVEHDGVALRGGDRIVLDVRAINHDPGTWDEPHAFRPERFLDRQPGPYEMVPQGGGSPQGHRCPGEPLAVQLLAATLEVLAGTEAPDARPSSDLTRIPPRITGT